MIEYLHHSTEAYSLKISAPEQCCMILNSTTDALFPFLAAAPLAPVIDTQKTLAYDQLYLCWRLPQDSAPAWHYSVEYQRRVGGAGSVWGGVRTEGKGPNSTGGWLRIDDVGGTCAVIDRLEMDSVYVLRVKGCNKAGFGEYSEEVYLHTPPAPGEICTGVHTEHTHARNHAHTHIHTRTRHTFLIPLAFKR